MPVTRRGLQIALGLLWVFDAALQLQPYMFSRSFAADVIAPSADGQPAAVAAPIHLAATVIAAHPVATNASFALIQLLLGIGLLWRRTARTAIWATIAWSLAVWWLGEGLGGLLTAHGMLLGGAPGAVALYAVVAAAALGGGGSDGRREAPRRWVVSAWAVLWMLGAVLQVLPGQNTGASVADALSDGVGSGPSWLHGVGSAVAAAFADHGWLVVALVCAQALVAVTVTIGGGARRASVVVGVMLAAAFWVFGQGLGELASGTSTDPNSAPLLVLLALAVGGVHARRIRRVAERPLPRVSASASVSSPA